MELENTLLIVADLGELKAFSVEKHEGAVGNEMKKSYSLKLITDENFLRGRIKLGDDVSDSAGRFQKGILEKHHLKDEREKRTIKEIAEDIEVIVKEANPKQLFLAFPKEHNNELTHELGQESKAILTKNITSDLVKTDANKLLSYFE